MILSKQNKKAALQGKGGERQTMEEEEYQQAANKPTTAITCC